MGWPFGNRRERLRREAADWFARLRGEADERDRNAFEQWYRSSPERAEAYNRLARSFETAGALNGTTTGRARSLPQSRGTAWPMRAALAGALACAAAVIFLVLSRTPSASIGPELQAGSFSTSADRSRSLELADGSTVLLSPGSRLEVDLAKDVRRLRLVMGEGLFSVSHETRPFVVRADGTEITAHGTKFRVRLVADQTTVSLIEGAVDVSYGRGSPSGQPKTRRLKSGDRLVLQSAIPAPVKAPPGGGRADRAPPMLSFDDTPMAEAVEQMNHRGGPPIRLGNAALGRLRVTGAFRAGDTRGFAESLAAAFQLALEHAPDGSLVLRSASGTAR